MTLSVTHIIVDDCWPTLLYDVTSVHWGLLMYMSHYSISIIKMWTWKSLCNTQIHYFYRHSVVDFLMCSRYCPVTLPNLCQALALQRMSEYTGIQRGSWSTQWLHLPRCHACKISPDHDPSTTVPDAWYELFVLIFCAWCLPDVSITLYLCYVFKHLYSN